MTTQNKRLSYLLAAAASLLLVPLIAMQFTTQVNWTAMDFIVAAGLLLGACLAFELLARRVRSASHRLIAGIVVGTVLVVVWVELAVGLFGSPWAGS